MGANAQKKIDFSQLWIIKMLGDIAELLNDMPKEECDTIDKAVEETNRKTKGI